MTFRVGQKVECIKTTNDRGGFLVKGATYTISAPCPTCVAIDPNEFRKPYAYIDLCGLPHPNGVRCNCWASDHFRLVVENKTDISIFTAMIVPERETA